MTIDENVDVLFSTGYNVYEALSNRKKFHSTADCGISVKVSGVFGVTNSEIRKKLKSTATTM